VNGKEVCSVRVRKCRDDYDGELREVRIVTQSCSDTDAGLSPMSSLCVISGVLSVFCSGATLYLLPCFCALYGGIGGSIGHRALGEV
jgi:hypothetical protein